MMLPKELSLVGLGGEWFWGLLWMNCTALLQELQYGDWMLACQERSSLIGCGGEENANIDMVK